MYLCIYVYVITVGMGVLAYAMALAPERFAANTIQQQTNINITFLQIIA